MDEKDVFQRNNKSKPDVVINTQDLMVGLKKEKEEVKKDTPKELNFDSYEEITEKTKEDLIARGIDALFPIQSSCFRVAYDNHDVIARALTGSGKTLAFCLPLVERYRKLGYFKSNKSYVRNLYAIILTPTRELAVQVANELKKLMHKEHEYKVLTVYGGVSIDNQEKELKYGVEFFVGTTGRVLDHIERGNIDFSNIKAVILDEADRMLDMGFQEDIEQIISKVKKEVEEKPQFLLFSATIPAWMKSVAAQYLSKDYKSIDLVKDCKNKTSHTVNHLAMNCPYDNKIAVLADVLRCYGGLKGKAIVFTQTKVEANNIILSERMRNNAEVLHGDIAQKQREVTLKRFKEGKFNVLVATDVAARGLDIQNVDLVIQLEPPKEIEAYIHRSGRTARAGKDGIAITFYSGREYNTIQDIESHAGIKFKKISPPKNEDIIKVAAADVIENLKTVDKKILPLFHDAADKLIEELGARDALCMALALISDTSKSHLSTKSLLSGEDGQVAYILKSEREIGTVSYGYKIIQRNFSEEIAAKVKGVKLLRNGEGIAFDLEESLSEQFDNEFKQEA
jgi:ATP-dependent RNA helicase DDX21